MEDSGDHVVNKEAFESPSPHSKYSKGACRPALKMQEASSPVLKETFTPPPPKRVEKKQVANSGVESDLTTPGGAHKKHTTRRSGALYKRKGRGVEKRIGRPLRASPGGRCLGKKRILHSRQILNRKLRQTKGQPAAGRPKQTNIDAEKQKFGGMPHVQSTMSNPSAPPKQEKINAPNKSSEATQDKKVRIALWAAAGESNTARAERVRV
eukprot:1583656-Pleurochrysis_carterae.AAC.1